jgi:hypothetical protein
MVDLTTIHTKVLLKYLEKSRKFGGFYSPYDNEYGWTTSKLKEELSTREHVPNKKESKLIRQKAVKVKNRF